MTSLTNAALFISLASLAVAVGAIVHDWWVRRGDTLEAHRDAMAAARRAVDGAIHEHHGRTTR